MANIDQIRQAIFEMGSNQDAASFVQQFMWNDRRSFLISVSHLLLEPELDEKIMTNVSILIGVALKPVIVFSLVDLAEMYSLFSEEEKTVMKQSLIRGLMHPNNDTRGRFAYNLRLYMSIEKEYFTISRQKNTSYAVLESFIQELFTNNLYGSYAKIGAIMALRELCQSNYFKSGLRQLRNVKEMIIQVSTQVLADGNSDDFTIEFKWECAQCLNAALQSKTVSFCDKNNAEKITMFQIIVQNINIPNIKLFKNIISLLTSFFINILERCIDIKPFVEVMVKISIQILENTINSENIDITNENESSVSIINMWKKIAKYLNSNTGIDVSFLDDVGGNIDKYLFSLISKFPAEDILSESPSNTIPFFALECLKSFGQVNPQMIFVHSVNVFQGSISSQNQQAVFTAICAAQLIFSIQDVENESIFVNILGQCLKLTCQDDLAIANTAYNSIITLCEVHPNVLSNTDFFRSLLESIHHALSLSNPYFLKKALYTFSYIIFPFDRTDENSNLSIFFKEIYGMLTSFVSRADIIASSPELIHESYELIGNFLSKLPEAFSNDDMLQLASSILGQIQNLYSNLEQNHQFISYLFLIVNGIAKKMRNQFANIASPFLEIIVNAITTLKFDYIDDLLLSARELFIFCPTTIKDQLLPKIFPIILKCQSTGNDSLIQMSSLLVSSVELSESVKDYIPSLFELIWANVISDNINLQSKSRELYCIGHMLTLYPIEMCQLILPFREKFLTFLTNLINFFAEYNESDSNSAEMMLISLLNIFTGLIKGYEYESYTDPENSTKRRPSPFLQNYSDKFIDLIIAGDDCKIRSIHVAKSFLSFLEAIIISFNTTNRMNVKIHKKCFTNYLNYFAEDRSIPNQTYLKYKSVRDLYNSA